MPQLIWVGRCQFSELFDFSDDGKERCKGFLGNGQGEGQRGVGEVGKEAGQGKGRVEGRVKVGRERHTPMLLPPSTGEKLMQSFLIWGRGSA